MALLFYMEYTKYCYWLDFLILISSERNSSNPIVRRPDVVVSGLAVQCVSALTT